MKWLKQCLRKPSLAAVGRLDWKAELKEVDQETVAMDQ